jgi:dephospho-CoA kinase
MQKYVNIHYKNKVLLQQQKSQIEEALAKAQAEHITRCAHENQINLNELDDILQPIIDSCTKDSIANGNYKSICIFNSKNIFCDVQLFVKFFYELKSFPIF